MRKFGVFCSVLALVGGMMLTRLPHAFSFTTDGPVAEEEVCSVEAVPEESETSTTSFTPTTSAEVVTLCHGCKSTEGCMRCHDKWCAKLSNPTEKANCNNASIANCTR